MLKTFLATTAIASLAAFGASAQDSPGAAGDPAQPVLEDQMAPADSAQAETDGTVVPETDGAAQDPGAAVPGATAQDPGAADPNATMPEEGYTEVDVATLSADDLIGTSIQTRDDQSIAEIGDVILSAEGKVENVVAQFGGVLGFGSNKVLLSMDDIQVLKDPNDSLVVRTDLTPEELQTRPPYEG